MLESEWHTVDNPVITLCKEPPQTIGNWDEPEQRIEIHSTRKRESENGGKEKIFR